METKVGLFALLYSRYIMVVIYLSVWSASKSNIILTYIGLLYQPWMIDGDDCRAVNGMNEWQGIPKYSEETRPSADLSSTVTLCLEPGSNSNRCYGKPTTYSLSLVMDQKRIQLYNF
jgi:hypothetical protein